MKRLKLIFAAVVMAINSMAQVGQVAILSHNEEMTVFYNQTALIDAYEKAMDGDVITLSSGRFHAVDINKNVTLRGVGLNVGTSGKNISPTYISGRMSVKLEEETSEQVIFEGLTFLDNLELDYVKNILFQKCMFTGSVYSNNDPNLAETLKECQYTFMHCVATTDYQIISLRYGETSFVNSVIKGFSTENNDYSGANVLNSIISPNGIETFSNCNFTNSIIIPDEGGIGDTSVGSNCIVTSTNVGMKNGVNITYVQNSDILFNDNSFYELSDYALDILGSDGKQLGIYGGTMPFESLPSGPKIKKFDVASKTTADGKLSVDIEIDETE